MATPIYDCVVADLSPELLQVLQGALNDKLQALQWYLHESDITIQYLVGEDDETCIIQLKGTWAALSRAKAILDGVVNGNVVKNEPPDSPDCARKLPQAQCDAELTSSSVTKDDNEEPEQKISGPSLLCEYCGEEKPDKPESSDKSCQTNNGREQSPERKTVYVNHTVVKTTSRLDAEEAEEDESMHSQKFDGSQSCNDEEESNLEESQETMDDETLDTMDDETLDTTLLNDTSSDAPLTLDIKDEEDSKDVDEKDSEEEAMEQDDEEASIDQEHGVVGTQIKRKGATGKPVAKHRGRAPVLDVSYVTKDEDNLVVFAPTEEDEPVLKLNETRGRKRKISLELITNEEISQYIEKGLKKANMEGDIPAIPCLLCDFTTNAKRHLRSHLQRCHTSHKTKCDVCGKTYGLPKDLRAHLRGHYPKHKCEHCDAKFANKTLLENHIQRNHTAGEEGKVVERESQPMHVCPFCDFWSLKEKQLAEHVARQHGERKFRCEVCDKAFGLEKDLIDHGKSHTDEFLCTICGDKRFRSKSALHLHIRGVHKGEKLSQRLTHYICDTCGRVCRNKTAFTEHQNKDHLHVKPFVCPICSMAFHSKVALKNHLNTHGQEKRHSCNVCSKAFKTLSGLRVHQLVHLDTSLRPYVCDVCKKAFSQRGALVRHERIHTGSKPYPCKLCESAFNDYSILRRHMLGVHKVNSRDLCQRSDVKGNKGGPKPDRIIVENIEEFQRGLRNLRPSPTVVNSVKQLSSILKKEELVDSLNTTTNTVDAVPSVDDGENQLTVIEFFPETMVVGKPDEENDLLSQTELSEHPQSSSAVDTLHEYYAVPASLSQVSELVQPQYPIYIQTVPQADTSNIAFQIIPQTEPQSLLPPHLDKHDTTA